MLRPLATNPTATSITARRRRQEGRSVRFTFAPSMLVVIAVGIRRLGPGAWCQIAVPSLEDHRSMPGEVMNQKRASDNVEERAVAKLLRQPDRPADAR